MEEHAVVLSDTEGIIRHWNAGAERLFGFTAAEAIGASLDLIVPEEYRDRHWAGFKRAVTTGVCELDRAVTNVPVMCRDGEVRPTPGRFVFLLGPREEVVGVAALYSRRQGGESSFGAVLPLDGQSASPE